MQLITHPSNRYTGCSIRLFTAVLPVLLLAACTTPGVVPVTDKSAPAQEAEQATEATGETAEAQPAPARPAPRPAVVALLDQSRMQLREDHDTDAARSVERALKLEPKNPELWYQYARIRYKQGQWQQAQRLAQKSHSLSAGNPELQRLNAILIGLARDRLDN